MKRLIAPAIKALEQGQDPLHESFLIEHDVTLDEAYELAEAMAMGLRLLRDVQSEVRAGGMQALVAGLSVGRAAMQEDE